MNEWMDALYTPWFLTSPYLFIHSLRFILLELELELELSLTIGEENRPKKKEKSYESVKL